jgi:hypothetical protein
MATETRNKGTVARDKGIIRTSAGFTDGVCYFNEHQGLTLNDLDVYTFLSQLDDERYSNEFNAGYVTGWIEALIEDRDLFAVPKVSWQKRTVQ